ncbi:MAG: hypothetical protein ACOX50_04730 [Patescibacteria group bacterium]|jgi:ASC-1-like (ASCH) protein
MHHIAIMKKSWGFLEKILERKKTIESRLYLSKHIPWNRVNNGDTIWIKNSGEPVVAKATVANVLQYENLTNEKIDEIMRIYGQKITGSDQIPTSNTKYFSNKKYAILVFLSSVQKTEPFNIDKTGFGAMSAWICVGNIDTIRCK